MNIFSKQNQSVAAAAAKVMAEQPAQVKPTTPTIPSPDTSMVDRAAGVRVTYGSLFGRKLSEEKTEDDKSDKYAPEHHSEADIKLDRKPTWPKSSKPLGKTTSGSADDGRMKEETTIGGGRVDGMDSNAAANLPAPIQKEKVEKKKMKKESFTSAEIVSHLKENTNDNGWYVDTKKIGAPVNHKYLSPMAVKRHVTEAIIEMNQIDQINEEADISEGAVDRISHIQVHPYESGFAVTLHSNNGPHSMETHPTKAAAVKSANEWHRATGKEAKLHLPEEVEQVNEVNTPGHITRALEDKYGPAHATMVNSSKTEVTHLTRHLDDDGGDAYEQRTHKLHLGPTGKLKDSTIGKLISHKGKPKKKVVDMDEEVEQVNELSKDTLNSYRDQAVDHKEKIKRYITRTKNNIQQSKDMVKHYPTGSIGDAHKGHIKTSKAELSLSQRLLKNRRSGIDRAGEKLAKEAVQKAPQYPVQEADSNLPFEGPYKKSGAHKDEFGNPVKNVARNLAKKGLATALKAAAKKKGK